MDGVGLRIVISTGREHRPVAGGDSAILKLNRRFYVDPGDGEPGLDVAELTSFLRQHALAEAASVDEELHHADFVITTDPKVVRELGLMHDCPDCQDSMSQTMAFMASNPGQEMVVGQIFWAGT